MISPANNNNILLVFVVVVEAAVAAVSEGFNDVGRSFVVSCKLEIFVSREKCLLFCCTFRGT